MPEFLEDPSSLTKEKLKSELLANDVPLPPGEHKKDVYVRLYTQHLTSRNRHTPEFSSDDEREATPLRGRGRPPGRKATKKTNKPNIEEEKKEQDVTELSNEALKEELLKYGVNPGPIIGSTRKLYEKRLLKMKETQVTSVTSLGDTSSVDSKQNGNSDSAQYSDNEEPKIDPPFETREPIRSSKSKIQVTSRSRRTEQNETAEETELVSELNVKRQNRIPSEDSSPVIEDLSTILFNISGEGLSEKMEEPEKVGRVQAISKESSRAARRTPRKRVVASEQVLDDDANDTDPPPVTETILPASNPAPVDIQVTEVYKHTNSLRAISDFSELSRRTPKKQIISEKPITQQSEADFLVDKVRDGELIGRSVSNDLLNTAIIEETGDIRDGQPETPKKTRQLKITKFVTPLKQVVEKTYTEERREDRDILKDMFPYESSTPTGISATCRRPIKGAAGRPLTLKDYKIDETYTTKYVPKYQSVLGMDKPTNPNPKPGRSIPMWIKILLFVVLAVFSFLVYQVMETNEGNPFAMFLTGESVGESVAKPKN